MPKEIPHLVFRKQPTIISEDPFKTNKEETELGKKFAAATQRFEDAIAKSLKKVLESRELGKEEKALTKGIIDAGIQAFGTDDLVVDAYEYSERGYMKGVVLSSQQLKPLNVSIDVGTSANPNSKIVKTLREKTAKNISDFGLRMSDVYEDIVYRGIEGGKSFDQIMTDIQIATGKGIKEANQIATEIIVDAARKAEAETLFNVGIEIYRWITVTDSNTCETCLALNGRIYKWNDLAEQYINFDTRAFLSEDLEELASEFGVEDWIITDADGPPIHHSGECRCHFQPVMTYEQYQDTRGSDKIKSIVSEL